MAWFYGIKGLVFWFQPAKRSLGGCVFVLVLLTSYSLAQPTQSPAPQDAMPSDTQDATADKKKPKPKPKLIGWGKDYLKWEGPASGYFLSKTHNHRLARVHVFPDAALVIYKHNARMIAHLRFDQLKPYPQGTIIVQETWTWKAAYQRTVPKPSQRSLFFMMQKQGKDYDKEGGNWRYGYALPNFIQLGEGYQHEVEFCRTCHLNAASRDHIYANGY